MPLVKNAPFILKTLLSKSSVILGISKEGLVNASQPFSCSVIPEGKAN